jgi:hypothetical protein
MCHQLGVQPQQTLSQAHQALADGQEMDHTVNNLQETSTTTQISTLNIFTGKIQTQMSLLCVVPNIIFTLRHNAKSTPISRPVPCQPSVSQITSIMNGCQVFVTQATLSHLTLPVVMMEILSKKLSDQKTLTPHHCGELEKPWLF